MKFCKKCNELTSDENGKCADCGSELSLSMDEIINRIQEEEDHMIPRIMAIFAETDALIEDRPWYVPTLGVLGYRSPNLGVEITLRIEDFVSPEYTKQFLLDLRDKHGFGKIFQWTVCPLCGWDVPVSEITIHDYCFFCLKRIKEEKENPDLEPITV